MLRHLRISHATLLVDISALKSCTALESVSLCDCAALTDITPLEACGDLIRCCLNGCDAITDFSPLARTGMARSEVSNARLLPSQIAALDAAFDTPGFIPQPEESDW